MVRHDRPASDSGCLDGGGSRCTSPAGRAPEDVNDGADDFEVKRRRLICSEAWANSSSSSSFLTLSSCSLPVSVKSLDTAD
eukprot:8668745-Pyramimonas_sp.AAC.1